MKIGSENVGMMNRQVCMQPFKYACVLCSLTPGGEPECEVLVDPAEGHDEDEVDAGARHAGDDLRQRPQRLVLEERDGHQRAVDDHRKDEDQHQADLDMGDGIGISFHV